MSRYDFGFLTVFWGDNDPQGRKKDPLRPPGGPGQPAARRVKKIAQGSVDAFGSIFHLFGLEYSGDAGT